MEIKQFDLAGIGSLLKDRRFAVPIYQRSYSWSAEQVSEFCHDLRSAFASGSKEYFLGTVVISGHSNQRFHVIDGQQRLATTTMFLSQIRNEWERRGDVKRSKIVEATYLCTTDLETASIQPKLHLNSDDHPFFLSAVIEKSPIQPTKNSHQLITDAYQYIGDQVKSLADDAGNEYEKRLLEWVRFLSDEVKVAYLEVSSEADAFLIFETLNDRGADLTIADLLKNYLFGQAGNSLDSVRDAWVGCLSALEIGVESSVFTTFLRHFWSSKHGRVRERDLYKSIKDRIRGETLTLEFMKELQDASYHYAALLSSDHEAWDDYGSNTREAIRRLSIFGLEQNRPLILAALKHFTTKEQKRLLKSIVNWSVRGLIVGGIGGGKTEAAFCSAAVQIRSGAVKTSNDVLHALGNVVATDDQFRASFEVANVKKAYIARYLLAALERKKKNVSEPEFVPNENEEQVNLEHVLPKKANSTDWGQFTEEERSLYLHRIGNLSLLQKGPNGKIGNESFAIKKPILGNSAFELTSEIGQETDWNPKSIKDRQGRLATLAVQTWPR